MIQRLARAALRPRARHALRGQSLAFARTHRMLALWPSRRWKMIGTHDHLDPIHEFAPDSFLPMTERASPASANVVAHLATFPEFEQATELFHDGKPQRAIAPLRRIVDVCIASLGPADATTIAATRRLITAQYLSGDATGARRLLPSLAEACKEQAAGSAATPSTRLDHWAVWRAAAVLCLSTGELDSASNWIDELLMATDDEWIETIPRAVQASWQGSGHTLGILLAAAQAARGLPHDPPIVHWQRGSDAWELVRMEETGASVVPSGEVGEARLEAAMAAYLAAVGRVWDNDAPTVDDEAKPFSSTSWDALQLEERENAEATIGTQCAMQHIDAALDMLPQVQHQQPETSAQDDAGSETAEPKTKQSGASPLSDTAAEEASPSSSVVYWEAELLRAQLLIYRAVLELGPPGDSPFSPKRGPEHLSEAVSEAIRLVEELQQDDGLAVVLPRTTLPATLARALATLARVQHGWGNAVTAEGLFCGAIDKFSGLESSHGAAALPAVDRLAWRDALRGYGRLLLEWDKRESMGHTLLEDASDIGGVGPLRDEQIARALEFLPPVWDPPGWGFPWDEIRLEQHWIGLEANTDRSDNVNG